MSSFTTDVTPPLQSPSLAQPELQAQAELLAQPEFQVPIADPVGLPAPLGNEWPPVSALRSAPQDALAFTFVAGIRDWVADIQPHDRRGLL